MTKHYTLHLIKFKELKRNEKIKREVTEVKFYNGISFDLAKHIAVCQEWCQLRFLDKKGNLCVKDKAISAIAYSEYENLIGSINPMPTKKIISDNYIFPDYPIAIELNRKSVDWERVTPLLDAKLYYDFSIEAYHIWGPCSLIPKGYSHVTEGNLESGDYIWNQRSSSERGSWVGVSYSEFRAGHVIKVKGMRWSGLHPGRLENELLEYYDPFVIRKKSSIVQSKIVNRYDQN